MPRYVQVQNQAGEWELWEVERTPPKPRVHIIGDFSHQQMFRSVIDGKPVESRKELREHMRKHNVIRPGDLGENDGREFTERRRKELDPMHWSQQAERKKDIVEAIEKLNQGYKVRQESTGDPVK